jgi:hypothetical protein
VKPQLNFWRFLYIACLIPLLTSCIVPIPLGSEISTDEMQSITAGITTKSEIEAMFGEPNVLDTPSFSVYRLSRGKSQILVIPIGESGTFVAETYDLTFSFDSNEIVKEYNYETNVTLDSHGYKSLDDEFPDQSIEILRDRPQHVGISVDGKWVSAISSDKLVLHEIDGKSKAIDIEAFRFRYRSQSTSSALGKDSCKLKFQSVQGENSGDNIEWLFANSDLTPFYKLCRQTQSGPVGLAPGSGDLLLLQLQISRDGSLLAIGEQKDLALWSNSGDLRRAVITDMPITNVNFSPDNKFMASIGTSKYEVGALFSLGRDVHLHISEINVWSVPSLENIAKIERKVPPYATAFSKDGRYFALASTTHIEIWERQDNSSEAWPYQMKKLIPQPVVGSYDSFKFEGILPYGKTLSFSSDGKLLMSVNGLLNIWDTQNEELLTQLGAEFGLLKAVFNLDNDLVVAGSAYRRFGGFNGVRVWKIPLSAVVTQSDNLPDPATELTSNLGLLIPSGGSPEIANSTDQLKPARNQAPTDINFANVPPPDFDLNGIYTSTVSRMYNNDYFCFNQKENFRSN